MRKLEKNNWKGMNEPIEVDHDSTLEGLEGQALLAIFTQLVIAFLIEDNVEHTFIDIAGLEQSSALCLVD